MILLDKTSTELIHHFKLKHPEVQTAIDNSELIPRHKGSMQLYQALALYSLCKPYNKAFKRILEIGTGVGYSTNFIAHACPNSEIVTLNPNSNERYHAENILRMNLGFKNIFFSDLLSWNYYGNGDKLFDVVFVDGNHKKLDNDLIWWLNVKSKGLMLFHDYSEFTQTNVFNRLNSFVDEQEIDFDVKVIDTDKIGMVGFYK